jgi:hypothetical protein
MINPTSPVRSAPGSFGHKVQRTCTEQLLIIRALISVEAERQEIYIPSVDYQHLQVDRPPIINSELVIFLPTCAEGEKVLGSRGHLGEDSHVPWRSGRKRHAAGTCRQAIRSTIIRLDHHLQLHTQLLLRATRAF